MQDELPLKGGIPNLVIILESLNLILKADVLLVNFHSLDISPGQVWVINSNFFLQLNLCVCYRENQFGMIVGPGQALLTLARSHICQVNKFVRKKSSLIFIIVTGTFNRPVWWFINSMLSKWTRILGGCKDCRPYSHRIVEKVARGIFFTSFYDWAKKHKSSPHMGIYYSVTP